MRAFLIGTIFGFFLCAADFAFSQSGQCPPGGCPTNPPSPQICFQTNGCITTNTGLVVPGSCVTTQVPCTVIPPPVPACMDVFGRTVACH